MVADRAYPPASFACTDRQANLFYFAASVPAVGFVHGSADLGPRDAVALESYAASDENGQARGGRALERLSFAGANPARRSSK